MDGTEFQQRVWRVMEDGDLTRVEKLVMIAYYLYEGNPTEIQKAAGQTTQSLQVIEGRLARKGWLKSGDR